MLEPAVDRLCWPVRCVGPIEVREHVNRPSFECAAKAGELFERLRHAGAERVDDGLHQLAGVAPVRFAIRSDHGLIHAPGCVHFDVIVAGEHRVETLMLSGGEQTSAGLQRAPGAVEGIAFAAAMSDMWVIWRQ